MKPRIPDKVKVGGVDYRIKFVKKVSPLDDEVDGAIFHRSQEILIQEGMTFDYTACVFFHELLHAIFEHCGFAQDETMIECLANCLYQVLKDNDIMI